MSIRMNRTKKIAICASLLFSAYTVSCVPSQSSDPGAEHGLGLYFGLLDVCKNYMLGGELPNLSVNDDHPKFKEVENWVQSNLLNGCYVAAKIDGKERAKYWIVMNSARMPQRDIPTAISKMLLSIPLTSQTLGPNYKQKIKELKNLMSTKPQELAN